jgi:hypothetical protein
VSAEPSTIKSVFPQFAQWAFALGLICLSLAVLNWGLQYKMSLYNQSADGIAHAPAAKLWMGKDGGSAPATQIALPELSPLLIQVTLLIAFLTLYFARCNAAAVRTLLNWRRCANFSEIRLTTFREAFFFRPPPPANA